jgi:hypothetical protein
VKLFLSVLGRRNLCKRVTDPRTLYKWFISQTQQVEIWPC